MPTVPTWTPPVALSPAEERVLRCCTKRPIFRFLRAIRHELFDDAFQRELATMYDGGRRGRSPEPPRAARHGEGVGDSRHGDNAPISLRRPRGRWAGVDTDHFSDRGCVTTDGGAGPRETAGFHAPDDRRGRCVGVMRSTRSASPGEHP